MRTIWSKENRSDVFYSRDKRFDTNLKQLIEVLTIGEENSLDSSIIWKRLKNDNVKMRLAESIKTHSTTELIESDEVLSAVVEIVQNHIP